MGVRRAVVVGSLVMIAGCGAGPKPPPVSPPDGGVDAGPDGGTADAGADAGTDAGPLDPGPDPTRLSPSTACDEGQVSLAIQGQVFPWRIGPGGRLVVSSWPSRGFGVSFGDTGETLVDPGIFAFFSADGALAFFANDRRAGVVDADTHGWTTLVAGNFRLFQGSGRFPAILFGEGSLYAYDRAQHALRQLARTEAPPRLNADGAFYEEDGTTRFFDFASAETSTVGPAQALWFDSAGRVAVWAGGDGQLHGWTADAAAVELGSAFGTPYGIAPPVFAGGRVFVVDARGTLDLWEPATGTVEGIATGVLTARIGPTGQWAVLIRGRLGAGSAAMRDLASGTERPIAEAETFNAIIFASDGETVVVASQTGASSRFQLLRGLEEIALSPRPDDTPGYGFWARFSPDLKRVSLAATQRWVYSTEDGTLRYQSALGVVPEEGDFSSWAEGMLLLRQGAYLGPPDVALYVWDIQRETEQKIADGTELPCVIGRQVFTRKGLSRYADDPVGDLIGFDADSAETRTVAPAVTQWDCGASDLLLLSGATLSGFDPVTGAHTPISAHAQSFAATPDHLLITTDGALCLMPRP